MAHASRLYVADSAHGRGLFTGLAFESGAAIVTTTGALAAQGRHTIQTGWYTHVLVAEPLRVVNHSCAPNTFLEVRPDGVRITLRAARPIAAGSELLLDYATFEFTTSAFADERCGCGAPGCRGRVGGYRDLAEADRRRLDPLLVDYLRAESSRARG